MKLVVVMCAGGRTAEVVEVLETAGAEGYAEMEGTRGGIGLGPPRPRRPRIGQERKEER